MSEKIDEKDLELLEELKQNSRLSEKKLSKRTGIPMTTVHNRLKKLLKLGIVRNYTVNVDYSKLGKTIVAYVLIKAAPQADQKKLLAYIAAKPNIYEVAMVTGEFDVLFKAKVASMEELNELMIHDLRKQKMVSESRTMISYETVERQ